MTHHPSADVCSPHPSADVCSPRTAPEGSAAAVGEAHGTQRTVQGAAAAKPQRGPDTKHAKHTKGAVTQDAARKHDAGREPAAARRPSPQPPAPPVRIGSPDALLAVVPALLGFEPGNSMVVIGVESPRAQVRLTLRYDLPDPPDAELSAAVARHAVSVLAAQHIDSAAAVGYGAEHLVSPVAAALRERAPLAGIAVMELLRAEGQRYWSYLCADPGCCPPEGTPFDIADHPVARAMADAGARILASRDELAAMIAPADGEVGEAMRRATRQAEERAARLVARVARSGRRASARRLIAAAGLEAVAEVIGRYRAGEQVGPEAAAWLTVVLRDPRVRDDAWARMQPEHRAAHLRLWTDLTRMARPGYVAAPASLLAFVAWQSGNGALANVALDRALADDARYSMARLLRQAIDSGVPPSMARLPMTPEEVAASYDDLEADEAGEAGEPGEADEAGEADAAPHAGGLDG